MTILALALIVTSAGSAAQTTPVPEERIIAWHRVCEVNLPLKHGAVKGTRWLTDDGARLRGSDNVVWTANQPGNADISPAFWYQIAWSKLSSESTTVRNLDGRLAIQVTMGGEKMPRAALFALRRPGPPAIYQSSAALGIPLLNWQTSYFEFAYFQIDDVLAYSSGLDAIVFSLEALPGSAKPHVWTKGTLDIAAVREAVASLPEIERLLAARAIGFATCKREPEYDDTRPDIL